MYVDNCTLNNVNTTAVIEHDILEHSPIVIAFQLVIDRKKNARPLVRKFPNQNQEKFLTDLGEQLRSSAAVQQNDTSELIKIMSNLTDKHFPKVQLSRRQHRIAKKPWLTKGILKSITTQNKLYAKYKRSNSTSDYNIYKEYRNKLTGIKEKAKAMYYRTLLGNCGNISVTWKTIKNILNKSASKDNSLPNQLNIIGRTISNTSSICNEFNRHFCNIGKEMAKQAPTLISDISDSFCGNPVQKSIYFEPAYENEVEGIISMFNPNKAQGFNLIFPLD